MVDHESYCDRPLRNAPNCTYFAEVDKIFDVRTTAYGPVARGSGAWHGWKASQAVNADMPRGAFGWNGFVTALPVPWASWRSARERASPLRAARRAARSLLRRRRAAAPLVPVLPAMLIAKEKRCSPIATGRCKVANSLRLMRQLKISRPGKKRRGARSTRVKVPTVMAGRNNSSDHSRLTLHNQVAAQYSHHLTMDPPATPKGQNGHVTEGRAPRKSHNMGGRTTNGAACMTEHI